jgi:LacI family transcriptional regulator
MSGTWRPPTWPRAAPIPSSSSCPPATIPFMRALECRGARRDRALAAVERTDIRIIDVPLRCRSAGRRRWKTGAAKSGRPGSLSSRSMRPTCAMPSTACGLKEGIPVVTVVSDLTGSQRHHYAGVDNIAAGRTAARLLGRFLGGRQRRCRRSCRFDAGARPSRTSRGFATVIAEEFPSLSLLPVIEGRDDPELAHMLVADALSKRVELSASTASAPAIAV